MPVIIPSGFAQATLEFTASNTESGISAWVLGFDLVALDFAGLSNAVLQSFDDNLASSMSDNLQVESITVVNSDAIEQVTAVIPGERDIQEPPPNVSLLVRKQTNTRGRRGQGRIYPLGFFAEGEVNDRGTIDTAVVNDLQTAFNAFLSDIETAGANMVVLQGSDGQSSPLSPPPVVTALEVQSLVATQRRRLR